MDTGERVERGNNEGENKGGMSGSPEVREGKDR